MICDVYATVEPWEVKLRYFSEPKFVAGYSRGVLRHTQRRDPFVLEALRHYDKELLESLKGKTRAPGGIGSLVDKLLTYDRRPLLLLKDEQVSLAYKKAVETVRREFKLETPIVPTFINDVEMVKSMSSGFPHFKKKKDIEQ